MGRAWTEEQKAKASRTKQALVAAGWKPWHTGKHLSVEDRANRSTNRLAKLATGWKPKARPKMYSEGDLAKFSDNGYKTIYLPEHPASGQTGFIPEHRLIAERALGRILSRNEVVHHINGDKQDNRNSNLLICSVAYHSDLHQKMSYLYQRMTFAKEA